MSRCRPFPNLRVYRKGVFVQKRQTYLQKMINMENILTALKPSQAINGWEFNLNV